ncbi:MAG TPA: S41 family peptidase [Steroidobacteraceae bacterium]|nr:S41 family peptidase [Steroidobacteraceae bacterium]
MSCGGGGDSAPPASTNPPATNPPAPTPPAISYTAGVYPASSSFASQCAVPRTGIDPATGKAYTDVAGSALAEKHFLRSWTNELYLWFSEVADRDPASVADVKGYFDLLKTTATVSSGKAKDQFHFTYDSAAYYQLSQSGASLGYGISWAIVQSTPPRRLVVEYVQAGSQAATLGIGRGAELTTIDGVDVVNVNTQAGVDTINSAVFAPASGSSHQLGIKDRGSSTTHVVTLNAATVTFDAVPTVQVLSTASGNLGYLLFNDHTVAAEQQLITAINQLKTANVQDLVLDLRYNGGGYLAIASEAAFMIAGQTRTAGKTFERLQFNSKNPTKDPVTGDSLDPMPFASSTVFANTATALPSLNLGRVYVLTSAGTCSASESIINSLKGIGVDVYQIGADTCGKPYGFYPRDNCGTTYFSIQFRGVNQLGFGDYAEGFSATRVGGEAQAKLPGCYAGEDYAHDLGDAAEERLRVAMAYRASGNTLCTNTLPLMAPEAASSESGIPVTRPVEPWRNNRFLGR